jgi:hypothetical protein
MNEEKINTKKVIIDVKSKNSSGSCKKGSTKQV